MSEKNDQSCTLCGGACQEGQSTDEEEAALPALSEKNRYWYDRPQGASKLPWADVCVMYESSGDETCGLCGTYRPEGEECYIFEFLDRTVVLECCGSVIDRLYLLFGDRFTSMTMHKFAQNPTAKSFNGLRDSLQYNLRDAMIILGKVIGEIRQSQASLRAVDDVVEFKKQGRQD